MKNKHCSKKGILGKFLSGLSIKNLLMLLLAGTINAFGVVLFLFPVKLYDSGISGLSMLLDQVTPPQLTLSVFLLLFNLPIFLFGARKQGVLFTIYSMFAVAVYSFMSYLIMDVLPIDVSFVSPLAGSDLLLCAIFGGVISGVGSGLTIRYGGTIDGIDVLSVIFAKRLGLSGLVCPYVQHSIVYCVRYCDPQLDTASLFHRDLLCWLQDGRFCCGRH